MDSTVLYKKFYREQEENGKDLPVVESGLEPIVSDDGKLYFYDLRQLAESDAEK